jgi:hypothetical protein
MPKNKDGVEFAPDGQIKLVVDGKPRVLRRPKIGELRQFMASIQNLANSTKDGVDKTDLLAGANEIAEWWSDVVTVLGAEDGEPLPTDVDELPVWLLSGKLIGEATAHWREVPYLSGG